MMKKNRLAPKIHIVDLIKQYSIVIVLVAMVVFFAIFARNFLSERNIFNIFLQASSYGIMALGMTCLIVTGYFDLSAGVVMCFAANLAVGLQHLGMMPAILIALGISAGIGCYNGVMITKVKINAFIVTLSTMLVVRGILYIFTGGDSLVSTIPAFGRIAAEKIGGMNYVSILMFVLFAVFEVMMKRSRHGRNTYAVGGNVDAAFNAGIKTDRVKIINFSLTSFMAGVGGIIYASRMNGTSVTMGWPDGALNIITCVVLGGTSLAGGRGGILYTLGGVFAFTILRNGLNMMSMTGAINYIVTGAILIGIVLLDWLNLSGLQRRA